MVTKEILRKRLDLIDKKIEFTENRIKSYETELKKLRKIKFEIEEELNEK
ncbi:hypothetical protein [Pseudoleptotrichia goodfellowii]|uniref:Putative membrane protein n=1 Tax=Pseudoleptotrichia goodfellowii TaxID=157692 RepID=A0A510J832_9FUSO|nr:hypothetical protein [Pseudoleptotrichia goodfellowii]BBM35429.1 putative membrane protein [Pseudoleptotrichia goodfellowii]